MVELAVTFYLWTGCRPLPTIRLPWASGALYATLECKERDFRNGEQVGLSCTFLFLYIIRGVYSRVYDSSGSHDRINSICKFLQEKLIFFSVLFFSYVASNLLIAAHSRTSSRCPLMQRSWEICVCSFGIAVNYAPPRASTHQRFVKDWFDRTIRQTW